MPDGVNPAGTTYNNDICHGARSFSDQTWLTIVIAGQGAVLTTDPVAPVGHLPVTRVVLAVRY